MWTRNFLNNEADYIYSLMPSTYDDFWDDEVFEGMSEDEVNEQLQEQFLDDIQQGFVGENIMEELIKKLPKSIKTIAIDAHEDWNRNFPWCIFGRVYFSKVYADKIEYGFNIDLICRDWYYEWVNFDFTTELQIDGYENDVDDMPNLVLKKLEKAKKIINEVYKNNTNTYSCIWGFSDGTWVYKKI